MERVRRASEGETQIFEWKARDRDGTIFWVEVNMRAVDIVGEARLLVAVRDITERKLAEEEKQKLESQLLHSQKLESVGRLAGGIAHDFNNMLSVILGNAELMKANLDASSPVAKYLREIISAGGRSREIASQLLAFSRKQIISPRPVDLNHLVESTEKTLAPLIGEDIDLRFYPGGDLWKVMMDPVQVDQILVNLAVNARDAMPDGGELTIETANTSLEEAYCESYPELVPGQYVRLTVSDSGHGMDGEALDHLFEPFFTTKMPGKGTGLGLATVYGIVKQNGGFINVYSEVDKGTTFKIYLARCGDDTTGRQILDGDSHAATASGKGTILLVEDDDLVRGTVAGMLEAIGYDVLAADGPSAALVICEDPDSRFDLLLTDVVMPEMNGPALSDKIEVVRPGIPVIFMSGYTTNVIVHHGVLEEGLHFIQKPVSMQDLAAKIASVLSGDHVDDDAQ